MQKVEESPSRLVYRKEAPKALRVFVTCMAAAFATVVYLFGFHPILIVLGLILVVAVIAQAYRKELVVHLASETIDYRASFFGKTTQTAHYAFASVFAITLTRDVLALKPRRGAAAQQPAYNLFLNCYDGNDFDLFLLGSGLDEALLQKEKTRLEGLLPVQRTGVSQEEVFDYLEKRIGDRGNG